MNRVIAEIFASLVSLMHIAVLAALAFATFYHFSDNAPGLDPYLSVIGLDRDWFLVALAAVGIVYVLIVGILSTIIAINQNLERLVVAIQESHKNEAE